MRVFLSFVFAVGVTLANSAPQGYNYQIQFAGSGDNELNLEQFQLLQEYAQQQQQQGQQQQQPQIVFQQQLPQINENKATQPEETILNQNSGDNNGISYQFANQLQQAKQLVQYEQQQLKDIEAQQESSTIVANKPVAPQAIRQVVNEQQEEVIQVFKPKTIAPTQPIAPIEVPALPRFAAQQPQQQQQPQQLYESRPQFNKEFFYLSAPQEDYEEPKNLQNELAALKKNLRVVFIKAPEQNGLENAAVQLAKQAVEQQTAIYVLTKQHDASALAQKLQNVRISAPKPEVSFIKYRTPEEAEQAQRKIQAQYEALDGPNHFNLDGVAPTHNFVGSTGIEPRKSSADTPVSKYLPASAKL